MTTLSPGSLQFFSKNADNTTEAVMVTLAKFNVRARVYSVTRCEQ